MRWLLESAFKHDFHHAHARLVVRSWTSELAKKHFSDLESLRGRIRANDIKGIQQPKQEARRAIRQRMHQWANDWAGGSPPPELAAGTIGFEKE